MSSNEITSTAEMAEAEYDGSQEPDDVRSDLVATKDAEGRGIEFHVSMRDYTLNDMEELIVEAAARTIVGRHNDHALAKQIEAKCIEQITTKADKALAAVTTEIIDQPLTPKFPFMSKVEAPVTMREFLGLTGRAYLEARVDYQGNPTTDGWSSKPRLQYWVERFMDNKFKAEIEKATNAAVTEIRKELTERHKTIVAEELSRMRAAFAAALTP